MVTNNTGTLSMEEFAEMIRAGIKDHLPDRYRDAEISFKDIRKENGIIRKGLNIHLPDDVGIPVPMIYLDESYAEYVKGRGLVEILTDLADTFIDHLNPPGFEIEISDISDFEKISDRILPKIVQASENQEIAKDRPSTPVADLIAIYRIRISDEASIPINNQIMNGWGVTPEMLHKISIENMRRMDPPMIKSMTEVLMESMPGGIEGIGIPLPDPSEDPMRVITTASKMFGAAALLDTEFMESIPGIDDPDTYLLPSSQHELICVSSSDMDVQALEDMVRSVNESTVDVQDKLADGVYRYNTATHEIERALIVPTQTQDNTQNQVHGMELDVSMAM